MRSVMSRRWLVSGAVLALVFTGVSALPAAAGVSTQAPKSVASAAPAAAAAVAAPVAAPRVPVPPVGSDPQPHFPIRAAFYYGWGSSSTHFSQTYGTDDPFGSPGAPRRNVQQMRYAGMNAGIASWMGQQSFSDVRFPYQLRAADGTPFRWSMYYEPSGRSSAGINSDLTYLRTKYAVDRNYLRVGGKPVLFLWTGGTFSCGQAQQWVAQNRSRFYLVFKVYPGYTSCPYKPSAYHEYGPAKRVVSVPGNSFAVSPGFWQTGWDLATKSMVASKVRWQLITTFNEWGEGTAVGPAAQWQSHTSYGRYLDLLHVNLWHPGV
jgi:hypothetical protein